MKDTARSLFVLSALFVGSGYLLKTLNTAPGQQPTKFKHSPHVTQNSKPKFSHKTKALRKAVVAIDNTEPDWKLLARSLKHQDRATRVLATHKLSELHCRKALFLLISALRDKDHVVRLKAARGIEADTAYRIPEDSLKNQKQGAEAADAALQWLLEQRAKTVNEIRQQQLFVATQSTQGRSQ